MGVTCPGSRSDKEQSQDPREFADGDGAHYTPPLRGPHSSLHAVKYTHPYLMHLFRMSMGEVS